MDSKHRLQIPHVGETIRRVLIALRYGGRDPDAIRQRLGFALRNPLGRLMQLVEPWDNANTTKVDEGLRNTLRQVMQCTDEVWEIVDSAIRSVIDWETTDQQREKYHTLYAIFHDLRTPVNTIRAYSSLLLEHENELIASGQFNLGEFLQRIFDSTHTVDNLVKLLLSESD